MSESVFSRMQRVVKATSESAVDRLERATSTSLMRQAIREVDNAAGQMRAQQEAAEQRRRLANGQRRNARDQIATLDEQARFALGKGREDLARAAVARQMGFEVEIERLVAVEAQAAEEIDRIEASLVDLKARKGQMETELAAFEAVRREAGSASASPAVRKATRAEETFDRAMAATGVGAARPADPGGTAAVAELGAMRREAEIAERLAGLRDSAPAAAPAPAKPRTKRKRAS